MTTDFGGSSTGWQAPRWLRLLLMGGGAGLLLLLLLLALRPQPVPVDLVEVRRGLVELAVEEDGRTRVRERYLVSAPLGGVVRRIGYRPGDSIEGGAALAEILPLEAPLQDARTQAQLQLRLASSRSGLEAAGVGVALTEAALVEARQELLRQETLAEVGGGSPAALQRARALLSAREAELRGAELRVEVAAREIADLQIALGELPGAAVGAMILRAPVRGVVLQLFRESEGPVAPGEPLLEIGDPGTLELVVDFLSADAVRIRPGQEAQIGGWGGEERLAARVTRVEPSAFTRISALGIEEQRVQVLLDPLGSGWDRLGDGFRVEARILLERLENVLHLPSGAVFRTGEGWAVFLLQEGRAIQLPVQLGGRTPEAVEILSGVGEGDRVVLYPGDRVVDGVRIRER